MFANTNKVSSFLSFSRHSYPDSNQGASELPFSQQHHLQQQPHMPAENGHLLGLYHVWLHGGILHPFDHHDGHLPSYCPGVAQKGLFAQGKGDSSF